MVSALDGEALTQPAPGYVTEQDTLALPSNISPCVLSSPYINTRKKWLCPNMTEKMCMNNNSCHMLTIFLSTLLKRCCFITAVLVFFFLGGGGGGRD